jgi:hypothetical protein
MKTKMKIRLRATTIVRPTAAIRSSNKNPLSFSPRYKNNGEKERGFLLLG